MMKNCPSKDQLLKYISEVSFACFDMLLYLDTHPNDEDALNFYNEHCRLRKTALDEYAKLYGPLTCDTADLTRSCSWEWVNQPWPWEPRRKGGNC